MRKLFFGVLMFGVILLCGGMTLMATSVAGTWDLYYDWGCNGNYSHTTITFTGSGGYYSCSTGGGYSGECYQMDEEVHIQFCYSASLQVFYVGNKVGGVMTGMMLNQNNVKGCWYMVKQGYTSLSTLPSRDELYQIIPMSEEK